MVFADKLKETEISEQDSMVAAQKSMKSDIIKQDSLLLDNAPNEQNGMSMALAPVAAVDMSQLTEQDSLLLDNAPNETSEMMSMALVPVIAVDMSQLTENGAAVGKELGAAIEDAVPVGWAPSVSEDVLPSRKKLMPKDILSKGFLRDELKTQSISDVARKANVQHSSVVYHAKIQGIDIEHAYTRSRKNKTAGGRASTLKEEPEASKKILKEKCLEESVVVVETAEGMIKGDCETSKTSVKNLPQVMKVTFVKYTKMEKALSKNILMEVGDFTLERVAEQYLNLFPGVELDDYHMVFQDKDGDWVVCRTTKELELAMEGVGESKLIFSIQPK